MKILKFIVILSIMDLSRKQNEMLQKIAVCKEDNKETDEEYMNKIQCQNIPFIFSEWNHPVTLNYEEYISSCKMKRAIIFQNVYNLEPFTEAMEEITNNEIILYRAYLENILQNGIHALMEIQFLDSLVILKKETCNDKLEFNPEMKNIMFLMKNLVNLFDLNPPTVANEIYEKERLKAMKDCNIDVRYMSPEDLEQLVMNIKLKSLSMALAKQHKCLIDCNSRKKSMTLF